ncbi:MAG: hypothetical protein JXB29_13050 [Sedimentisphaerales bacterium]|nr:hypothetical protein [Sedimentisphaerales bacterium]
MKLAKVFTKKEVVAVICCAGFLIANLGAIGAHGRRKAKEIICLSNLQNWGFVFLNYASDNNGYLFEHKSGYGEAPDTPYWYVLLKPYYGATKLLLCPEATLPTLDASGNATGAVQPFAAWGIIPEGWNIPPGYYGSYGLNYWVCNENTEPYWQSANVPEADTVPVLADCWFTCSIALDWCPPPPYNGHIDATDSGQMGRYCLNRHEGKINSVFLDGSARKVGLKELWALRWSRVFDTSNAYTIAGHGGDSAACKEVWDSVAPWMSNMPEY